MTDRIKTDYPPEMIRAAETPVDQSIANVRNWLRSFEQREFPKIAADAGVHEKTLRLAVGTEWNPTAKTLNKLLAVIPKKRKAS